MIEQDTIRLLRECDSGAKMGMDSFTDVLDKTKDPRFRQILSESRHAHEELSHDIQEHLKRFSDDGKAPSPLASGMAWMKTHLEMAMDPTDETIADLMTDGCNMGVKSLSKYLHQYEAADEKSKQLAMRLIDLEDHLARQIRPYL